MIEVHRNSGRLVLFIECTDKSGRELAGRIVSREKAHTEVLLETLCATGLIPACKVFAVKILDKRIQTDNAVQVICYLRPGDIGSDPFRSLLDVVCDQDDLYLDLELTSRFLLDKMDYKLAYSKTGKDSHLSDLKNPVIIL